MRTKRDGYTDDYLGYSFNDEDLVETIPEYLDYYYIYIDAIGDMCRMPTVYTFYDSERHPLYVGKTVCFIDRYANHQKKCDNGLEPWMNDVAYIGTIIFDDLNEMDLAEIIEIHRKHSRYNRDCNNDGRDYRIPFVIGKSIQIATAYTEEIFTVSALSEYFAWAE